MAGSVNEVRAEELVSKPVANVLESMQGALPGLTITRSSGQPGAEGFNLQIRGASSLNTVSPLVLIDGFEGKIGSINPRDIASVVILKDASAAIYGARAANGVLLVTTKQGNPGKPKVEYSMNYAITNPTSLIEKMGLKDILITANEAAENAGGVAPYPKEWIDQVGTDVTVFRPGDDKTPYYLKGIDWWDEMMGKGNRQNHSLSISGGNEDVKYRLSAGWLDENGVYKVAPHDSYDRADLRLNFDFKLSEDLRIYFKSSYVKENRNQQHMMSRQFESIFKIFPFQPIRTQSGENYFTWYNNPVDQTVNGGNELRKWNTFSTNIKAEYDLFDGMRLIGQAGLTETSFRKDHLVKQVPLYDYFDKPIGYAWGTDPNSKESLSSQKMYRSFALYAQYDKTFNNVHNVTGMIGATHEEKSYDWFSAMRKIMPSNELFSINLGDSEEQYANSGATNFGDGAEDDDKGTNWTIQSVISRLGYIYDNKYIFESVFRYDGSSRFHSDDRWGLFPGVMVAWRASEESFMKDLGFFDNLKLRLSWGQTGNQSGIGLYDYIPLISIGGTYPFGDAVQGQGARQTGMVSRDRSWETVENQNIGVDMLTLRSRLSMSFDFFKKMNKDMLIGVTYPSVLGANAPATNSGELETKGWELQLGWNDKAGELTYHVNASVSDARNKLVYIGGQDTYNEGLVRAREGYPINSYWGYSWDGIIQNQQELDEYKKLEGVDPNIGIGDARYKDLDGNGKIHPFGDPEKGETGDLKYMGSQTPRYEFNLSTGIEYKNFDFSVSFQGLGKKTLFRSGEWSMPWYWPWHPPIEYFAGKTWTPENTGAKFPRNVANSARFWNWRNSENNRVDGAYIRLKNIQIGYTLPDVLTQKLSIQRARIYFSGQDLWTAYSLKGSGYDPEAGRNQNSYPFTQAYSFGIDVTF